MSKDRAEGLQVAKPLHHLQQRHMVASFVQMKPLHAIDTRDPASLSDGPTVNLLHLLL